MAGGRSFELVYDDAIRGQLVKIGRKYHSSIRRAIETPLRHQPGSEARNRKPLARPSPLGSAWELRCGPDNRFRVFYRIDTARRQVRFLAVGVKIRHELFVGGERFLT